MTQAAVATMSSSTTTSPRYRVRMCPDDLHAEEWLNAMAQQGYRFLSMTTVTSTHHFTKEQESQVWVVVEAER